VHILTFNDYLARRDAGWMGPIYQFLGLRVGFIQEGMSPEERRGAYEADVTYATAKEAGFDCLRDALAVEPGTVVHRPFNVALVDEADSILIDEARIPLVIAGNTERQSGQPERLTAIVRRLVPEQHYVVDRERRTVYLTDDGLDRAEALLGSSLARRLAGRHRSQGGTAPLCGGQSAGADHPAALSGAVPVSVRHDRHG